VVRNLPSVAEKQLLCWLHSGGSGSRYWKTAAEQAAVAAAAALVPQLFASSSGCQ